MLFLQVVEIGSQMEIHRQIRGEHSALGSQADCRNAVGQCCFGPEESFVLCGALWHPTRTSLASEEATLGTSSFR